LLREFTDNKRVPVRPDVSIRRPGNGIGNGIGNETTANLNQGARHESGNGVGHRIGAWHLKIVAWRRKAP